MGVSQISAPRRSMISRASLARPLVISQRGLGGLPSRQSRIKIRVAGRLNGAGSGGDEARTDGVWPVEETDRVRTWEAVHTEGGERMELKGSKTEQNLLTAFAGESQARNRYTYFASQAKKDGFVQIQSIFEETANQEK